MTAQIFGFQQDSRLRKRPASRVISRSLLDALRLSSRDLDAGSSVGGAFGRLRLAAWRLDRLAALLELLPPDDWQANLCRDNLDQMRNLTESYLAKRG